MSLYFLEVHKFVSVKGGTPWLKCIYTAEYDTITGKSKVLITLN